MGIQIKQCWIRTLPIIAGLGMCLSLFQNFSLDNEYRDIRAIAPSGSLSEPPSPYFPDHTNATSLDALGNEILQHNFGAELKQIENQFEDWSGIDVGPKKAGRGPASANAVTEAPSTYRFRTGHLGKDKVGFRLQSEVNVKCEYSALKNELLVSVDKSIGKNANLSFKHNTDDHKSSLNFSYAW